MKNRKMISVIIFAAMAAWMASGCQTRQAEEFVSVKEESPSVSENTGDLVDEMQKNFNDGIELRLCDDGETCIWTYNISHWEESFGEEGIPEGEFIPSSFLEEKAGKERFASYDELISYLEPGQAYAYVNVLGSDEPIVFITEETREQDGIRIAAGNIFVYINRNGDIIYGSILNGDGTENPVKAGDDGLLYGRGEHRIEALCIAKETGGIMVKAGISEETDEDGTVNYIGFVRETNEVYDDGEWIDTDSDEAYRKLLDDYEKAVVPAFTVVQ